jgi:hypothetical protein
MSGAFAETLLLEEHTGAMRAAWTACACAASAMPMDLYTLRLAPEADGRL